MARNALFFRTLRRRACLELFARFALDFARLKNSKKRGACAGVQLVHAPLIQSILSNKGLLSAVVKCIFFSAVYFNLLTCFFVFVATTVVAAFVVGFALGPLIYPNVIQK